MSSRLQGSEASEEALVEMLDAAVPAIHELVAAQRSLAARTGVAKRQGAPLAVDPVAVAIAKSVARPFIQQILRYAAPFVDGCMRLCYGTWWGPVPERSPSCAVGLLMKLQCTDDHDRESPVRRSDGTSVDHEAAFQEARDRVQEWLQEFGALSQIAFPQSARLNPAPTERASVMQAGQYLGLPRLRWLKRLGRAPMAVHVVMEDYVRSTSVR